MSIAQSHYGITLYLCPAQVGSANTALNFKVTPYRTGAFLRRTDRHDGRPITVCPYPASLYLPWYILVYKLVKYMCTVIITVLILTSLKQTQHFGNHGRKQDGGLVVYKNFAQGR